MRRSSKERLGRRAALLTALLLAALLVPSFAVAKILASQALAAGIQSDTLDQVKQDLLMDLGQRQKYEFDQAETESLGRDLIARGETTAAVEVLQINQTAHYQSPQAAVALGDAYQAAGDSFQARVYYDMALNLDPGNQAAQQAIAAAGDPQQPAMGAMGGGDLDLAEMQKAMAQMGAEMTPEQMQEMQKAMAQMEAYQQDPSAMQAAEMQRAEQQRARPQQTTSSAPADPQHESEFCEVLHRFNAEKRISDPQVRARVEGNYGVPGDSMRTWNVETACGDFLVAVPLWADVSPPVMTPTSGNSFEDAMGGMWAFEMGGDGKATGVAYTSAEGTTSKMKRLGDPKSFD